MAIIQVQVGKNIVEDVWIDGGASVNIITENLGTKLGFTQTETNSIPPHNGRLEYDQTFRNHKKIKDSYTWYTICSHIYYFEKQHGGF
jgi:hypothetical protein